ncbi:MAG: L-fucose/L-arabinose isomerase family protein [Anaerolineae bacterium]
MTTFGVIVGNRGFFPAELCEEGRETMLGVLEEEGYEAIALSPNDTSYGSVETYEEAKECAELFRAHEDEIDGIIVTLPNFGDEGAIANTLRLADLDLPVLVQAFPDELGNMDIDHRRDSFCGKMSACNNLSQYGIPYSLTTLHTVDPESESFREDLHDFAAVCRVVDGVRGARFGQVGARPTNFNTVRYSEKILENAGVSVETIDLSEIFGRASALSEDDEGVKNKRQKIVDYTDTGNVPQDAITKMAKLAIVLEAWIDEYELVGTAIQCWTAMEEYYGVVPCTVMSMLSNQLVPSACETDVTGLLGMYAMVLASGRPSALFDWNNNYGEDPNKAVFFHCSNIPQAFFANEGAMDYQEIIAGDVGKENTFGTIVGRVKPADVTYCRISTDDLAGNIRTYLGEARITDDPVDTFGGYGVIQVPDFQKLLHFICAEGFEHHVATNLSTTASALYEAFTKYLGWDVYYHGR